MIQQGDTLFIGAKVLDKKAAKYAWEQGLSGLEFLYTIPGTFGGGLRMNAGAFGSEIAQVLDFARIMTLKGDIIDVKSQDMGLGYRTCGLPQETIFLGGSVRLVPGNPDHIRHTLHQFSIQRKSTQPSGRTGGSTFKNPPHHKAWSLIDQAGMRGFVVGDAMMSPHHCNFMINRGRANALDLESLGEQVREMVYKTSNILLEWEIVRVGENI